MDPDDLNYKFSIFGKNWDKIDKFEKYNKGFFEYFNIPTIYASTSIVIDDANHVTKKNMVQLIAEFLMQLLRKKISYNKW